MVDVLLNVFADALVYVLEIDGVFHVHQSTQFPCHHWLNAPADKTSLYLLTQYDVLSCRLAFYTLNTTNLLICTLFYHLDSNIYDISNSFV